MWFNAKINLCCRQDRLKSIDKVLEKKKRYKDRSHFVRSAIDNELRANGVQVEEDWT